MGGTKANKVDFRLITATHRNLAEEVRQNKFREDLFFRIVGLPIELPPLRNRQNDVIVLAKHFINDFCKENKIKGFDLNEAARSKLKKYHWPGNVRELKAVVDLACIMADGKEIDAKDLTFYELGEQQVYSFQEKTLKEYEMEIIGYFLKKYDNNVVLVADKLDIGKSKIYNSIKAGEIKLS